MQLHYLGTGAADWDPNQATRDMAFRRLTAAKINTDLMIDCGPCVFEFEKTFGYSGLYRDIRTILVTHSHSDHFHARNIEQLANDAHSPVTVYGDPVIGMLLPQSEKLRFVPVRLFETITFGRYAVTALPANHSTQYEAEQPVHYVIADTEADKRLFWGCDGAWLLNSTYHHLTKLKFDAMILDCTVGDLQTDFRMFEHNNIRMIEEMLKSLVGWHHILKDSGKVYANHMARTLHSSHDMLTARLAPLGVLAAYDNLIAEI